MLKINKACRARSCSALIIGMCILWTSCGDERRPRRLHKKRERSRIVLPWAIIHGWGKTVSEKSVSEKERTVGKSCSLSAPKLTMRILFSQARAIFLPHRHYCTRGLCMPLWYNNVHCTSEQCYPSVSLYNRPPCIPALSCGGSSSLFSSQAFWENKRHHDWQLRRVRIARVISCQTSTVKSKNWWANLERVTYSCFFFFKKLFSYLNPMLISWDNYIIPRGTFLITTNYFL